MSDREAEIRARLGHTVLLRTVERWGTPIEIRGPADGDNDNESRIYATGPTGDLLPIATVQFAEDAAFIAAAPADVEWLLAEVAKLRAEVERLTAQKDGAYAERDKCVAALATLAHAMGWTVYLGTHVGEWEDDWRNIVFIDTPYGQVSWHYHDSEREWFAWIGLVQPREPKAWDGHSTPEKYERLRGLVHDGVAHPAVIELRRVLGHALRLTSEATDWNATVGCESDAPGNSTCIDMGIDPCGPCKIGQAAEELEALLRGRKSDSFESRATAAEAALAESRARVGALEAALRPYRHCRHGCINCFCAKEASAALAPAAAPEKDGAS